MHGKHIAFQPMLTPPPFVCLAGEYVAVEYVETVLKGALPNSVSLKQNLLFTCAHMPARCCLHHTIQTDACSKCDACTHWLCLTL